MVSILSAVVTAEPVAFTQNTVAPTRSAVPPSDQQSDSDSNTNSGSSNDEDRERRTEELSLTTTSQEPALAKQPIFDLNGGGIAGQNMVCK
jgi:hypothetical protein